MAISNVVTYSPLDQDSSSNVKTLKSIPLNKKTMGLASEIDILSQKMATGNLVLNSHAEAGKLQLFYGRLLYATSDCHRVRRWQRAIALHCHNWNPTPSQLLWDQDKPWEYLLLYDGISQNQITISQAKAVIRTVALEVLFSLSRYADLTNQWEPEFDGKSELSLGLAISYRELEPILAKVAQMQDLWKTAGFDNLSPDLAPTLKKPANPEALSGWARYLQGDLTLWDISWELRKSVLAVTRALLPLVKKGLVKLRTIPDLPVPKLSSFATVNPQENTNNNQQKKPPLIACIDDSPVVGETLKKIVEPAGYDLLLIQDPIAGFMQIAQQKPDLIFLDLEMPNANGYTVYQFLRKAPIFQKTPVIILTSRNNLIDRSRAKLIGVADFLSKPPKPEQTLEAIAKHLSTAKSLAGN